MEDSSRISNQVEPGSATSLTHDIVDFHDDQGLVTATIDSPMDQPIDGDLHTELTVVSFLERPKIFRSGSFTASDVFGTLGGVAFPPLPMPLSVIQGNTINFNKLQGIQGIKYDLEFTIVVNATRFTQGLYAMYFVYDGGVSSTYGNEWLKPHIANPSVRSQLHHVRFDLSCDTKAVLHVPWSNHMSFTPLSNFVTTFSDRDLRATGNLGYWFIAPFTNDTRLLPATENAKFTVYQRFTNVKLIGAAAIPQMYSIKEAKSKNAGPIESALTKVSKVMSIWNKAPLLSSYVTPLKWVVDMTSQSASVFGWSRPANESTMVRVKRKPMANVNNVDVLDNTDNIGLCSTNSVHVNPSFSGVNVDELDIANFASRFGHFRTLIWSDVQTSGTSLLTLEITPASFVSAHGVPASTNYTPVAYLSTLFRYWRGSFVFRFTIVRTEFHSGRIQVSFNPIFNRSPALATFASTDFQYRDIIDIRETSSFSIAVPYTSPCLFLPTDEEDPFALVDFSGILEVYVVDPLVAPDSVSSAVIITVEVCAGPDIEFSVPKAISIMPVIDVVPQMADFDCSMFTKSIGNTSVPSKSTHASSLCIGEKISNLRTLLKRYTSISNSDSLTGGLNSFVLRPKAIQWYDSGSTNLTNNAPDLYGHLGAIFALNRGGVRIKYVNPVPKPEIVGGTTVAKPIGSVSLFSDGPTYSLINQNIWFPYNRFRPGIVDTAQSNTIYFNPVDEYGVEVTMPQYSLTQSIPNAAMRCGGRYFYPQNKVSASSSLPSLLIIDRSLSTYDLVTTDIYRPTVMRAGSEDTNFGCFVSIPPMVSIPGRL